MKDEDASDMMNWTTGPTREEETRVNGVWMSNSASYGPLYTNVVPVAFREQP